MPFVTRTLDTDGATVALHAGWKFTGTLVEADNTETGCLWEYPLLLKLPEARKGDDGQIHFDYNDQEVGKSSSAERDHVFLTGMATCAVPSTFS